MSFFPAIVGNVAHGSVDSGNPVKGGAKAKTSPKGLTTVADGNRTDILADADGMQYVKPFTSFGDILNERVANTDGASTAFTNFSAGGAGVRNYVTSVIIFNSSSTDGYVDLRDGVAGAQICTVPAPKAGGAVVPFPVPLRQPTANTALAFDVSAAISTVYISLVGFQSKL